MVIEAGKWYSTKDGYKCMVVSINETLEPPQAVCWLEEQKAIDNYGLDQLYPITSCLSNTEISLIATASKIFDLIKGYINDEEKLIAPIESAVTPLPHQLEILKRVSSSTSIRFLLADEVGLGKTVEAGLIMDELILKGEAKRVLIVVPKGLAMQWVLEMKNHFNLDFKFIEGSDIPTLNELYSEEGGIWKQFDRIIVSQDSIKPLTSRRGWDKERIDQYNNERIDGILGADWDLIIVDEAHRLGGSTSNVARYKLGKQLSEASNRLLLLTATPHQGKSDSFFRLLNILDNQAFPDEESLKYDLIQKYVLRTQKRKATDASGHLLFQPRSTILKSLEWTDGYENHKELYNEITSYVRDGYNKSIKNKKPHIGFLMVLLQRLVSSSTRAIQTTLERRLALLEQEDNEAKPLLFQPSDDDFDDISSEEQQEELIHTAGILDERDQIHRLLNLANVCVNTKDDLKAIELAKLLEAERFKEKKAKFLIFTEFIPTQDMLVEFLELRNYRVVRINGSMSVTERQEAQNTFAQDADILVSTDAGGEGLNLQFCHIVINYDLPWNPMKIEQRIGRVDRIGQSHPVTAYNFIIKDTVEYRVRDVLENKLHVIAEEFGVDKTSDVLESDTSAKAYVDAFVSSVVKPEKLESNTDKAASIIKDEMREEKRIRRLLPASIDIDNNIAASIEKYPYRFWTEQLVRLYLEDHSGSIRETKDGYSILWPDGSRSSHITFGDPSNDKLSYISIADDKVKNILASYLTSFVKGENIPVISQKDMPAGLSGIWGLFLYSINNEHKDGYIKIQSGITKILPIFISDNGAFFKATAEKLWSGLVTSRPNSLGILSESESITTFDSLMSKATSEANKLKDEIVAKWEIDITNELNRLHEYYVFQDNQSSKTALEEVRQHRQQKLALFNDQIDAEIKAIRTVHPKLHCLMMLRLEACNG